MAQDRVAFITAAAGGLARGIAIDLARRGYTIAFTHRPGGTPPDATLADVRAGGPGEVRAYAADHARVGETRAAIEAALSDFGTIDAYVHAVGPIVVKGFANSTLADARAMIAGNFESAIEGASAVLPGMREREFGRLVFFGANGSHVTQPAYGMSLYGAAKAAVVSFARTLALEEGVHGITVNVVEPGDIRDKRIDRIGAHAIAAKNPSGHAGSWEDVAAAVRFLLSPDASFISGATIGVNGGLVATHE